MNYADPWSTFTQITAPSPAPRPEVTIVLDYLDADEAATMAGLILDISEGADKFQLRVGQPDADVLVSLATLEEVGLYLDGYIAGQEADQ